MIKNLPSNFHLFDYGWHKGIDFDKESELFVDALDSATKENDIQKYIKDGEKWFIPASIMEDFDFGHHWAYLVPEQPLGSEYRVDYMIIGKNSIGYHIILMEFEDVNIDYRLHSSNTESEGVRKGLTQIRDWKRWMDDNRNFFFRNPGLSEIVNNVPSWGIHYCLVVSRRDRIDDIANQMRGQLQHETSGLHIVSYDRLADNIKKLSNGF